MMQCTNSRRFTSVAQVGINIFESVDKTVRMMVSSLFVIIAIAFPIVLHSETLTYNTSNTAPAVIECIDPSTNCTINCVAFASCSQKPIHCHRNGSLTTSACFINLIGNESGKASSIYTHQSSIVHLNVLATNAFSNSSIYAHEKMGSKLYLYSEADYGAQNSDIYCPIGQGSLCSIICGGHKGCRSNHIYDDWTTEVFMQTFGVGGYSFFNTEIKNIFDNSTLNISPDNDNYTGLNRSYRAPVFLTACDKKSKNAWQNFKYYGHNHGNWTLYGLGNDMFRSAQIYATANIPPFLTSGYDSLIRNAVFRNLLLNANQEGANIYVEVTEEKGLEGATIYARKDGGDCKGLTVECPEDNKNNTCKIYCDDSSHTDCTNMEIYTTNGYCKDVDVLCIGNNCTMTANIYCGYNQTTNYCDLQGINNTGRFECINSVQFDYCNNNYTEAQCINFTMPKPIAISTTFEAICNIPTTAPTAAPTITPTLAPTPGAEGEAPTPPSKVANDEETNASSDNNIGLIIAVIIGALLFIVVLIAILYYVTKNKRRSVPNHLEMSQKNPKINHVAMASGSKSIVTKSDQDGDGETPQFIEKNMNGNASFEVQTAKGGESINDMQLNTSFVVKQDGEDEHITDGNLEKESNENTSERNPIMDEIIGDNDGTPN